MAIDPATRASLEIEKTLNGGRDGSLLSVIDRTVTAPGARMLASRLARPLLSPAAIDERMDAIGWLLERRVLRERLRVMLKSAGDMARSLSRLALGRGGPRDLGALREGLAAGEALSALFAAEPEPLAGPPPEISNALAALDPAAHSRLSQLLADLRAGLGEDLPAQARDGGFVAARISPDLDQARALRDDSRRVILDLEARLQAESGVSLKIRHNAVLGYFVDTTAKQAEALMAPPLSALFIHRQTTANQVRFTTVELADLDAKIAQAGERALAIEVSIFEAWRQQACQAAADIQTAAEGLARLDVAAGLAEWAEDAAAVRPRVDSSLVFDAEGARHPVVEAAVRRAGDAFTPNDCCLDGDGEAGARLSIVTGPNMAGKSTFLRQNALMAILAQAGCYVPARRLRLGVVDRLFSRVGAGDDLARGRSTFMAEMVETAAILTQATARSFVILDEIGRGTATYDGPGDSLGLCRGPARHQPLPRPVRHPLSRAGGAGGAPGPCQQSVAEGQGVERRSGLPARGGTRAGGPLLRCPGGAAGRGATDGGGPGAGGAGPAGKPEDLRCRAGGPAAVRRRGRAAGGVHRPQRRGPGPQPDGCRRHEPARGPGRPLPPQGPAVAVPIKALMVDVDGVVVRHLRPGHRWDADLEADLGVKPADLQRVFFEPHFKSIVRGLEPIEPRLTQALLEIAPNVTAQAMMAYWFEKDAALDHVLLGALAGYRARGLKLHLATVQEHRRADYLWTTLGLKDRFDGLQHSAAVGHAKPEPAYYAAVEARTGFASDELLLIDDSERNVEAAIAAGGGGGCGRANGRWARCSAFRGGNALPHPSPLAGEGGLRRRWGRRGLRDYLRAGKSPLFRQPLIRPLRGHLLPQGEKERGYPYFVVHRNNPCALF